MKYIINKMAKIRNYHSELYKKNPKLLLKIRELFYKPLDYRRAVLYNDNEELKIIQKLETSEKAGDLDLLIDLENIRHYCYVNFKDFSKDGFKLRTPYTLQTIRDTNLNLKKNHKIELRIGHDSLDLNIIGLAWKPSNKILECYNTADLININELTKQSDNGFNIFITLMEQTFNNKYNQIYYWLFNTKKDIIKINEYKNVSSMNINKNIKTMLTEIYHQYENIIITKLNKYINKLPEITFWNLENLLKIYDKKYNIFKLNRKIKNIIISNSLIKKLIQREIIEDEVDSLIPGKRNEILKLPDVDEKIVDKNIIDLTITKVNENILLEESNKPICYHYIKWKNIKYMSKKNSEEQNQAIFNFVKQYVKPDKKNNYICKSCDEILNLKKYVYEGTYIPELDTFLTTSLAVNQNLQDLPKYFKFTRTIRNIEKNLEKISYLANINFYLGNEPVTKLHRKMLIKEVIDLVLIHTEYLKKGSKSRTEEMEKKYNINKSLTNLFFFELQDNIFLTSSADTDYYKLIKYNNIITYIIFIIITEMNVGQILSLKDNKRCNFFIYTKIGKRIFDNLYLRKNKKEKIVLSKIPLLSYLIFYFSSILTSNEIWLWNKSDEKKDISFNYTIQKIIIHTVVDLINSIIEANMQKDKNFLYELIKTRLFVKINTFNDVKIIEKLRAQSLKKIRFNKETKKISFIKKKIKSIHLNGQYKEYDFNEYKSDFCISSMDKIEQSETEIFKNSLNIISNCPDGKFHKWKFKNKDMICLNCNQKYSELIKKINKTDNNFNININILNKIYQSQLKVLTKTFCLDGKTHKFNIGESNCIKCKINPLTYKYSIKELNSLEENIKKKNDNIILKQIQKIKNIIKDRKSEEDLTIKILKKFNSRYEKYTNNKLENYVQDFIEKIKKILGLKVKNNNEDIYLDETIYKINHDYLGNKIKNPIFLSSKTNKIQYKSNHEYFKIDVLYYRDKSNNVYVYYNAINYNYLGYSSNNKDYKHNKSDIYIEVILSIKDMIMQLGLSNNYYDINNINSNYTKMKLFDIQKESNIIIDKIIRLKIHNIKHIISRTQGIIYRIKHHIKKNNIYSLEEKKIINEFTKILKDFKINNQEHKSIFQYNKYIINGIKFNKIPKNIPLSINKNYINIKNLVNLNNIDSKLIFYLIYNFNKLLEYIQYLHYNLL